MSDKYENMKIARVKSVDDPLFKEIRDLLEEAFVPDERREYNEDLLAKSTFNLFAAIYEDEFIGFRSIWNFGEFCFVEHAAIKADKRSLGLGSILYKKTFDVFPNMLFISELERPDTEIARRRIEYNNRLGCHLNLFDYIQPPYGYGKSFIPMYINSYPRSITEDEYLKIKKTIYEHIYNYFE